MRQGALDLAVAAKAKKPADVKKAAEKMDNNCKSCHKVFRDECSLAPRISSSVYVSRPIVYFHFAVCCGRET